VSLCTLPIVWLVRTLHVSSFLSAARQPRRPGGKPGDYTDRSSGVSNTRVCGALGGVSHNVPALDRWRSSMTTKKPEKLWIVWKTQDVRLSKLWITRSGALFVHRPSVRIGAAHIGDECAPVTLKIAARRPGVVWTAGADRTYVRVIHKPSIVCLRRVRPIHRTHRIEGTLEASGNLSPTSYTHCAARIGAGAVEGEKVVHICGKPC
jgi:hypothetical protein